jgi:hypothetical protein
MVCMTVSCILAAATRRSINFHDCRTQDYELWIA